MKLIEVPERNWIRVLEPQPRTLLPTPFPVQTNDILQFRYMSRILPRAVCLDVVGRIVCLDTETEVAVLSPDHSSIPKEA